MAHNYARVRTGDFDDQAHDDGGAAKAHTQPRSTSAGLGLGRFSTGSSIGPGPAEEMLHMKMREQDSNLEALGSSVLRLGDLSLNISKEIELQNVSFTKRESHFQIRLKLIFMACSLSICRQDVNEFCLYIIYIHTIVVYTNTNFSTSSQGGMK
jgi:hypothetical protein